MSPVFWSGLVGSLFDAGPAQQLRTSAITASATLVVRGDALMPPVKMAKSFLIINPVKNPDFVLLILPSIL